MTIKLSFDHVEVQPGDQVTASIELRNTGSRSIPYQDPGCGGLPATLEMLIPIPQGPKGASWPSVLGEFKAYTLANGLGPGMIPSLDAMVGPFGEPCVGVPSERRLEPGTTVRGQAVWTAQLAPGIALGPGLVAVRAVVRHDPLANEPFPTAPPGASIWIPPSRMTHYQETIANNDLQILGFAMSPMSAGLAIDAALANTSFKTWLEEQPSRTWSGANLWLDAKGWHVELFREVGVPRNFGRVTVQPVTGKTVLIDICTDPCGR